MDSRTLTLLSPFALSVEDLSLFVLSEAELSPFV